MIIKTNVIPPFSVNVGRPVFLNEEQIAQWKKIHKYVKSSNTPVVVNSSFPRVENALNSGSYYQGNSNTYNFWFNTANDKNEFVAFVENIWRPKDTA